MDEIDHFMNDKNSFISQVDEPVDEKDINMGVTVKVKEQLEQ